MLFECSHGSVENGGSTGGAGAPVLHLVDFVDFAAQFDKDVIKLAFTVLETSVRSSSVSEVKERVTVLPVEEVDGRGWHHQMQIGVTTLVFFQDDVVVSITICVLHDGRARVSVAVAWCDQVDRGCKHRLSVLLHARILDK